MNPYPAYFAQWTVGENRGVFNWNVLLIIEAIGHPAAQRFPRKPAFVHTDMERMFVVISACANRAQVLQKNFAVPECGSHIKSLIHVRAPTRNRKPSGTSVSTITSMSMSMSMSKRDTHMTISDPS